MSIKINFSEPVALDLKPATELSSKELSLRVERLASHEAEVSLAFLVDLHEFSKRKLHVALKYPNIFQYLIKHLKMPKGVAYPKWMCMKALAANPELGPAFLEGQVSLSTVSKTQIFLEKIEDQIENQIEKKMGRNKDGDSAKVKGGLDGFSSNSDARPVSGDIAPELKREIFKHISGKTVKETESYLADLGPVLLGEDPKTPRLVESEIALPLGFKEISLVADPNSCLC